VVLFDEKQLENAVEEYFKTKAAKKRRVRVRPFRFGDLPLEIVHLIVIASATPRLADAASTCESS